MRIKSSRVATIMARELHGYFTSPLAYVFIVIFLMLSGFFTFNKWFGKLFMNNEASLSYSFFAFHPWLYLLLVPAIAMRLWSEEYKSGTVELLFTMPVTVAEAVIGKFLAAWTVIIVSLVLTFPTVYTVCVFGSPDYGLIVTGYIASALLAGGFLAIGSFTSALTRNQIVSFIFSLVICLLMILISFPAITDFFTETNWAPVWFIDGISSAGVLDHFNNLKRGLLDLRDIVYFVSLILVSLTATGIALVGKRAAI